MTNSVIILTNGYSFMDPDNEEKVMKANCSCVLIIGVEKKIIVDTMTPWDKEIILQQLGKHSVQPDDIDLVVSTHGHSDHCGNNNLFLNAQHIVGHNYSYKNNYYLHDFTKEPFHVDKDIEIISTPGHTLTCVSVIVRNATLSNNPDAKSVTVAVTGDLFENANDINDDTIWLNAVSEDRFMQRKNRYRISSLVDFIIPGHGEMFRLTNEMRCKLQEDCEKNC